MNSQSNIILGTLGSVSDGKSEMIFQLSGGNEDGIRTQRDSREKKRNITINAGYANIKCWKCLNCDNKYSSNEYRMEYECEDCNINCIMTNHLSFIDCPGHQELITTMLSNITLMNGAIIVISVVDSLIKKPQLMQHLLAAKVAKIENIIICLNKCDLVSMDVVKERKLELENILNKLELNVKVIIPTSFTKRLGLDYLVEAIDLLIPKEIKYSEEKTIFNITRTFDVNKPGINYKDVVGGCIGGSLVSGNLKIEDIIEIKPGILIKQNNGKYINEPIITRVLSIESDKVKLDELKPGTLAAILTDIDPYYCKSNLLVGNVLGKEGELPIVYNEVKIEYTTLSETNEKWIPKNGDKIFLQIDNASIESRILKSKGTTINFQLLKPACIDSQSNILICKKDIILKIVAIGKLIN